MSDDKNDKSKPEKNEPQKTDTSENTSLKTNWVSDSYHGHIDSKNVNPSKK